VGWRRHFTVPGCLKKAMLAAPLAVILIGASAVGAQASTDATWTIANSPNATVTGGNIESVSCSASTACTAVGTDVNTAGIDVTLAERWNGASWQRQATPNPAGDTTTSVAPALVGVSCPTASFCVAVGNYQSGFDQSGLVEDWNGTAWTLESSPNTSSGGRLVGVSCASSQTCTAVGEAADEGGVPSTLIETGD